MERTIYERTDTWVAKDGTVYRVRDMGTDHLRNCVRFMGRLAAAEAARMGALADTFSGDGSTWAFEQAESDLASSGPGVVFPVYDTMQAELFRRGSQ